MIAVVNPLISNEIQTKLAYPKDTPMKLTRRQLIKALSYLPVPVAMLTMQNLAAMAAGAVLLEPTPELPDADDPTPPAEEGPFYKPKSPKRSNLVEPGMKGETMVVSGRILDRNGREIPNVQIEVWHADAAGQYDNVGFKCRGHFFSGSDGRYKFESVYPGLYPGRTRHFHVRVQPANKRVLTTQLFFPDEPGNARDGIFNKALLMKVKLERGKRQATFDFVLDV